MLLACTLFGLAAMHTLGHAGLHMEAHTDHRPAGPVVTVAAVTAAGPAVMEVSASVVDGCPGCPHGADPSGSGHGDGGMSGWDVCLAVLTGFAALGLLAGLLLARSRPDRAPSGTPRTPPRVPRGPPLRLGLVLAAGSVLRV
ncbi:hypothetical protein EV385_5906 [Krasilnikovia cinnamomea]|uniref:Uncharacterized protein n=2 Tax=Krasilnikovia cinnamomea TaxID=349313 RepID=A0A4Q7ZS35_9ACTN|nr:hypothetical protein EV385_5906 [Krasilnikovia cinnamomea]